MAIGIYTTEWTVAADGNHDAKRAALDLAPPRAMDGAWRRPPKSLADYGHTEPRRGAEWWGKSVLLTFALFKSEPLSERNPRCPLPK